MKAIYKITNNINNKVYIGQSVDPNKRFQSHISRSKNPVEDRDGSALHWAMHKYGIDNFTMEILGWYEDYNEKEKEFIKKYNSISPNGYNILKGGEEPPHRYGENHPLNKYSQELVDKIIEDLRFSNLSQKEIERKYQINQQLIIMNLK